MSRLLKLSLLAALLPLPALAATPDQIRTTAAVEAYEGAYAKANGHKAFAHSPIGAWDWSIGETASLASQLALARCNASNTTGEPPCILVDVDGVVRAEAGAEEAALIERYGEDSLEQILQSVLAFDGRYSAALRLLGRLPKAQGTASERAASAYHSGMRQFKEGAYAEAIASLQRAATLSPGMYQIHYVLGISQIATGDIAGADVALRRALRLEPYNPDIWMSLAYTQYKKGAPDKARAAVMEAYLIARPAGAKQPDNRKYRDRQTVMADLRKNVNAEVDPALRAIYQEAAAAIDGRIAKQAMEARERALAAQPADAAATATAPRPVASATPACGQPVYPMLARSTGQQGPVAVAFQYGKDGAIVDRMLVQSSGSRLLDEVTLEALAQCKPVFPASRKPDEKIWQVMQFVWRLE